jgi:peptidoglycan/xylan/chitin deacetylase (PgdA/CDA1 family)
MGYMKAKSTLNPTLKTSPRTFRSFLFALIFLSILLPGMNLGRALQSEDAHAATLPLDDLMIPILAYHKIDLDAPTEWYVSVEQFTRQMDVLLSYGYQTINLDDFLNYRAGLEQPPEKPIIITFDDGFQGLYQYARPILLERQMTATFFLITSKIAETEAERQSNDWQTGEPLAYHMIWPEVQQLYQDGFTIGSHTQTHPALNKISLEEAEIEITQSRLDIQAHLPGDPVNFFAYPYGAGSDDSAIRGLVQQAGYQAAVQYGPDDGLASLLTADIWALPRRAILKDVSLVLNPNDPWWFFMRRVDPEFPLPNVGIHHLEVEDVWQTNRTKFYPDEQVNLGVHVSNWDSPADVRGSLTLSSPEGVLYRSQEDPSLQEPVISSLPSGANTGVFTYTWSTPAITVTTPISYVLTVRDPTGFLTYFTSTSASAISIQPAPLSITHSPQDITLVDGSVGEVVFTVNADQPAIQMYLTVSLSQGLDVDLTHSNPSGAWQVIPIGSMIKSRECTTPCIESTDLAAEIDIPEYGSGEMSFTLGLRRLPGAGDDEWMRYRLTMRIPTAVSPYWYQRDPRSGITDQQDYFAYQVPVLPPFKIYFPVIFKW